MWSTTDGRKIESIALLERELKSTRGREVVKMSELNAASRADEIQ